MEQSQSKEGKENKISLKLVFAGLAVLVALFFLTNNFLEKISSGNQEVKSGQVGEIVAAGSPEGVTDYTGNPAQSDTESN
ncbi:hypothetical protein OZX60_05630 [Streptococcaceae bacterium ESL0687]|nr:hypothetical protein OZX60_05630 [Streptococcaceae bacterium ESL0687]